MANNESDPKDGGLFESCNFVVIRSAELNATYAVRICDQLRLHGGEARVDEYPEERLDLENVSHIVSLTSDFPDYHNAAERFVHVVKPAWIQVSLATNRLAHPRRYSPDPKLFLSEIVATCADLPDGDTEAIAGGVLAMGGNYSEKLTTQVTHIIALTEEHEKIEQARAREMPVAVVLPHWIDDCLKLGKKIDEAPYMLPNPAILHSISDRAPTGKANKHVKDASHPDPSQEHPEGPTPDKRQPCKVFKGKKVVLEADLGISQYLRGILDGIVVFSGGSTVEEASKADMLICKYRKGENYETASRRGIDVGNLSWLFYIIVHNTWTSPLRRLLHYPTSDKPLPGFEDLKISLSNYSGEARTYLENLIKATGAECTKTLRQENTHLITAHTLSEKVAAARDWDIHVVNHLWLEESYARWSTQSISNNRYTHFPKKTNLGEVVGQTEIDRDVLVKHFFPPNMADVNDQAPPKRKAATPKVLDPTPSRANIRQGNVETPRGINDTMQTPATSRHVDLGKENMTPATTGSRKSKDAAAAKLHDMSSDILLYEKEKNRKGGVVYGGRRTVEPTPAKSTRKRSVDLLESDEEATEAGHKRQRKEAAPVGVHLLISGYTKWVGKPKEEDADTKKLRNMGISIVTDPEKASHIAVPRILRTAKFLTALAYAPAVISTDFIDECLEQDEALDPSDFTLKDAANEKKFAVSLETTLNRAKQNEQQLLAGRTLYCVEKIKGGFEPYQGIVEANGGTCLTYRGRRMTIPSRRSGTDDSEGEDPDKDVYLISGNSTEEKKHWKQFLETVRHARKTAHIVQADWLLDTAMCQQLQPASEYAWAE